MGYGTRGGDGRATRASASFVPAKYAPLIARAAQRWSVGANLLAAQIYAEPGFNPFAHSPAGRWALRSSCQHRARLRVAQPGRTLRLSERRDARAQDMSLVSIRNVGEGSALLVAGRGLAASGD